MVQRGESNGEPRHPTARWAAILGILLPGLGYLYAGRIAFAAAAAVTIPLIPILLLGAGIHRTPAGAVALLLIIAALLVVPAVHVVRICRSAPSLQRSRARSLVRYGLFIVLLFAWQEVVSSVGRAMVGRLCVRTLKVTSESMAPTLRDGDWIVVDACRPSDVSVGGLALFGRPDKPAALMIKRIIATAGDTVQITPTAILVNGGVYASHPVPVAANQLYGPVTLDPATYFLVGDNLPASSDSRHFGPVQQSLMRGPVLYVLWSPRGGIGRSLASLTPSR